MTCELLRGEPGVVTTGVDLFAQALAAQAVATTPVEWRPPPPGTEQQLARVANDARRAKANTEAIDRMLRSTAELVDIRPARAVLGLEP